jgi:hypothetical protein
MGSSIPQSEKQPRQYLCVAESFWDNSEFVQAGFHIGRFVTVDVDPKADQENIKALYSNLESTSAQIYVSA